jgi:hypothetical protein
MSKAPMPKKVRKTRACDVEDAFPHRYKGMCEFAFNDGSFSFVDVIDYLLESTGKAHVDISTWVASTASTKKIEDFLEDSTIHGFRFLVDKGFVANRKPLYDHIVNLYGDVVRVTKNHAKFCLIYNNEWNFVIETSANLNKNARLENFRITEHLGYRQFFSGVFNSFFDCPSQKFTENLKFALR